jgi:hypothetical protein
MPASISAREPTLGRQNIDAFICFLPVRFWLLILIIIDGASMHRMGLARGGCDRLCRAQGAGRQRPLQTKFLVSHQNLRPIADPVPGIPGRNG